VEVQVRQVRVRTALTRSRLFDYCVNPYAGCGNACVYCYARFATRFSHPGEEWGSFVDVRSNAASVLRRELLRATPGTVYMSSVCDAWQPAEATYGLSRQCLALLLEAGYPLFLQTKNTLIERDFDLLAGRDNVRLGVTVTTDDAEIARVFEPRASSPRERLRVVGEARRIGLRTFAFLGPLLPGISDRGEGLRRLMEAVADRQPDSLFVDRLNRRSGMWPALSRAVNAVDPALLPEYRRILFSTESAAYEAVLRRRVTEAASAYGLLQRMEWCF
jgi:DNA repair photolyase